MTALEEIVLESAGYCPVCDAPSTFKSKNAWLRGNFKCERCQTIPRERALVHVLGMYYPNWRELTIHESSASPWLAPTRKFRAEVREYIETQYYPDQPLGSYQFGKWQPEGGWRNENLEEQTFPDKCFDIVITQDVFEHIFFPDRAIKEIARTLRPGGAHICTVPITQGCKPSRRRASLVNGEVKHLLPPDYHANPVSQEGSLVTIDWGYDIAAYFAQQSGLVTTIVKIDNLALGIRAELNEVLVCQKLAAPSI